MQRSCQYSRCGRPCRTGPCGSLRGPRRRRWPASWTCHWHAPRSCASSLALWRSLALSGSLCAGCGVGKRLQSGVQIFRCRALRSKSNHRGHPPPAAPPRIAGRAALVPAAVPCSPRRYPCPAAVDARRWSPVLARALQDMARLRQQSRAHSLGVLGFAGHAGKSPIGQLAGCRPAYTYFMRKQFSFACRTSIATPIALFACSRHGLPSNKPPPGSQLPTRPRCPQMLNAGLCMPAKEPHTLVVSPALLHRQHDAHGSLICPHGDCARRSCL